MGNLQEAAAIESIVREEITGFSKNCENTQQNFQPGKDAKHDKKFRGQESFSKGSDCASPVLQTVQFYVRPSCTFYPAC